ncbi:MAG: RNA 2',3'-cyclic phosphodiesterase [Tenuifilaceae bacterium]
METIRTFVAIDVNVENNLKVKWRELKSLLRSDSIKWVDEHSLHLTLFFLGDTEIETVEKISIKLEEELHETPQFKINLKGWGIFGNHNFPKVIWTGISESQDLKNIKKKVNNVVTSFGFEEERRDFSPHFTLGRVKHIKEPELLASFIQNNKTEFIQESLISRVIFYKSELRPSGPIYTPIKTIKLLSL